MSVRAVLQRHRESVSEPLRQIQPEECIFRRLFKGISQLDF